MIASTSRSSASTSQQSTSDLLGIFVVPAFPLQAVALANQVGPPPGQVPQEMIYLGHLEGPVQAISVLSTLADRYDPASVERTAVELAEQTLRYLVDSGQAEAFTTFLEEEQKPCPPEKLERFGIP